jgi:hypothetical protein
VPQGSARAGTISTISMEDEARIPDPELASEELPRKLRDAQETPRRRMAEHDSGRARAPDAAAGRKAKADIATSPREEKELRVKERTALSKMANLEGEVAPLATALDASSGKLLGSEPVVLGAVWRGRAGAKPAGAGRGTHGSAGRARPLMVIEAGKWARARDVRRAGGGARAGPGESGGGSA